MAFQYHLDKPLMLATYTHTSFFGHHSFTVLAICKEFWEMQLFAGQQNSNKLLAMEEEPAFLLVCNTRGWHLYNTIFAWHCPKYYFS